MARFGRGNGGERSAAEREAARLERERRRAVREGLTPPPAPESPAAAADEEPQAAAEPRHDEQRALHEEPQAAAEPRHDEQPALHEERQAAEQWAAEATGEQPTLHEERQAAEQWAAEPTGESSHDDEPQATQQWAAEPHDGQVHDDGVSAPQQWAAEPHDGQVHDDGVSAPQYPAADGHDEQPHDEPQATQQWSVEQQQEPAAADDTWGWEDDQARERARLAVSAGTHGAGEGGDEDEEILDQPTVAFTPEEEHAATTPPAPPPAPRPAPDAAADGRANRRTVQLPRAHAESTGDEGHHYEEPIGTRRGGRPYAAQPGAPPPGHRQITVPRRGRRRRLAAALFVLVLLVAGAGVFAYKLVQPGKGTGSGSIRVVIPTGSTASQIGDRLAKAGVVDSGFFFDLRARLSGHRGDLRAGSYALKRDMSYAAAITALTTAPKAVPVLNATLPEGPSRRELAPLVRQAGVRGSYLKATARSSKLNPHAYGAARGTRALEGFLFPATYELRRSDATATKLVDRQLAAFSQNIKKVDFRKARSRNLTVYDVLTIASMIEREARVPRERPLIAAVIYNRLRQGIPLGIDATIRYYERNWSQPLRVSELQRDEPYNTRMHQGLPPTPIGNPGLASIQAAAAPAKVGYLYYVVKPCGNGAHSFSASDAQFQRDVAAYNRKRDQLGGKDPSSCKK